MDFFQLMGKIRKASEARAEVRGGRYIKTVRQLHSGYEPKVRLELDNGKSITFSMISAYSSSVKVDGEVHDCAWFWEQLTGKRGVTKEDIESLRHFYEEKTIDTWSEWESKKPLFEKQKVHFLQH